MNTKTNLDTIVYWDSLGKNSYLYGTSLDFDFKTKIVNYKNVLAHTGIIIKSWSSLTNYQSERIIPQLPILIPGKEYTIKLNADITPKNTVYVKVSFYDIYNDLIQYDFIKNGEGKFVFPEKTFKYKMELFNAGAHEMVFRNIRLSDSSLVNDFDDRLFLRNEDKEHRYINILFMDKSINSIVNDNSVYLQNIKNLVVVNGPESRNCYISTDIGEKIKVIREEHRDKDVNFLSYSSIGNVASLYYSTKILAKVYLFDNFQNREEYEELIKVNNLYNANIGKSINELNAKNKLYFYGQELEDKVDYKFVNDLFDNSYRIESLVQEVNRTCRM